MVEGEPDGAKSGDSVGRNVGDAVGVEVLGDHDGWADWEGDPVG